MKIFTLNLKGVVFFTRLFLRIASALAIFMLIFNVTTATLANSSAYTETVSDITDNGIIIIDAGHGGEDCGAVGVGGVLEKDLNLSVSYTLGELLSDAGYAVVYTRTQDKLLYTEEQNIKGMRKIYDLKNRCKIAAEHPNALFVSIHMNSYGDAKYSGLQVYYSDKNADSQNLASSIQASVKGMLQPDNKRVIKPGRGIYLLENTDNVSVLIECGFISNAAECEKLSEKEYQKELCFSILCGIIEYKEKNLKEED